MSRPFVPRKADVEMAQSVLKAEAEAIIAQIECLGSSFWSFYEALRHIHLAGGRLVVCGAGKCAAIAQKVAGTFSSLGTPAYFLHPSDALHGDLGVVCSADMFLFLSNSGETPEVISVARWARAGSHGIASITSKPLSTLARVSTWVISLKISREACNLNLAPTSSTTAMLAIADAIAVTIANAGGLTPEAYLRVHPAGALGERLRLKVKDVMHTAPEFPLLSNTATIYDVVQAIGDKGNLGIAVLVNADGILDAVITDGDIRRLICKVSQGELLTKSALPPGAPPRTIGPEAAAAEALREMEAYSITSLVVTDTANHPLGVVHIHDILGRAHFTV